MEIIKRGCVPFIEAEHTCKKCNTTFRYKKNDVHFDRDGDYVVCPICGQFINVDISHLMLT